MPSILALIDAARVVNVFVGDPTRFPGVNLIDITNLVPLPQPGWSYDGVAFAPPVPAAPLPPTPSDTIQCRRTVRLTASDPAVPVPAWAEYLVVTAVGAGGGGGLLGQGASAISSRSSGGGAGGYVLDAIVPLAGISTMSVTIGAGGVGGGPTVNTFGAAGSCGGDTVVVAGKTTITCEGGSGATGSASGTVPGGRAYMGPRVPASMTAEMNVGPFGVSTDKGGTLFQRGASAGQGQAFNQGYGAGAMSPFSPLAGPLAAAPTTAQSGTDAVGFGGGGAGAVQNNADNGVYRGGHGAPGLVMLTFLETL